MCSDSAEAEQMLQYILRPIHSWMFLAELIPCVKFHAALPAQQLDWLRALVRKVDARAKQPDMAARAGKPTPIATSHGMLHSGVCIHQRQVSVIVSRNLAFLPAFQSWHTRDYAQMASSAGDGRGLLADVPVPGQCKLPHAWCRCIS